MRCTVEGCMSEIYIKKWGLCSIHYKRNIDSKKPGYATHQGMKARCYSKTSSHYRDYGARGIRVCDRWRGKNGYRNFLADMGPRPAGLSLDRIDNNGNYEPGNCRWATPHQQSWNTRKSKEYVGIRYDQRKLKWIAILTVKGEMVLAHSTHSFWRACFAREVAERLYGLQ